MAGYNCQTVTTEEQIIVGRGVTNVAPDTHHLPALVDDVKANCGERPGKVLADTGYWAPENAEYCEAYGIDAYIAVGRERRNAGGNESGADPPSCPQQAMRRKMSTQEAREVYRARKWIVEPPFGQIKEAMGFRRFLLRGLQNVRAEWALVCTAHNLLELWRNAVATV